MQRADYLFQARCTRGCREICLVAGRTLWFLPFVQARGSVVPFATLQASCSLPLQTSFRRSWSLCNTSLLGDPWNKSLAALNLKKKRLASWFGQRAASFLLLIISYWALTLRCFPGSSASKESACHSGDPGSIPGSGRSPGEGNGLPLQYSCLENTMDRGTWWATVHGVAKSRTRLSD